jgi:MFS family permease
MRAAATSSTTGTHPAGAATAAPVQNSPTRTIGLLAVVCTLVAMMQSLIAPLLTVLPPQLNTTPAAFTWAVTASLLAGAVSTPIAGRLGDMLGKKTVIIGLLIPMVIGCAVSALATNLPLMLVGRTLQGVALGAIPVSIALLQEVVPPHRRATAIALASASMGIGGGIALPLSAGFAQFFSWRALFWIVMGLGAVLTVLIAVLVPKGSRPAPGQRFDAPGAVLLATGLIAFLIALSQGSVWGWTDWTILGSFGLALASLCAWAAWELRASQPLVDLRAAITPVPLLTNAASIFTGMAMYITLVATPQILQLPPDDGPGLGVSLLAAGLLLLPGGIIQMLLAPVGGRLINARGPKVALLAGIAIIACGYGTMQVALASAVGLMLGHMIIKGGIGIAYGAMPALIMRSVSPTDIGSATSFNTLMRQIGSSMGSAVVGAVLAAVAITVGGDVLLTEAGFRIAFLLGLIVALVALAIAAFIPFRRTAA